MFSMVVFFMPLLPWQDRHLIRCLEVPDDIQNAMMARPNADAAASTRDQSRGRSPRRDAGDPWGYGGDGQQTW